MEEMLFEGPLWFYRAKIVKPVYIRPPRLFNSLQPQKTAIR